MAHILILYKLKSGVTREDFHDWLKSSNAPALRAIKRLKDFTVYRVEKRVMDVGEPSVDYVELFDIPDMAGFVSEDLANPAVRKNMEEFRGFANNPEYLLATALNS